MPGAGSLAGKVALVTGASREAGIGAAICRQLARAGAHVFLTYYTPYDQDRPWGIQPDEPRRLLESLRATGVHAEAVEADLADPSVPERLIAQAEAALGPLDILVNNATYDDESDLEHFTVEALDRHYAVNVRGATLLCVAFARRFRERIAAAGQSTGQPASGRIINMVSGELLAPMTGNLPYVITKGAVDALTITLSASLAPLGITVNAVDPGPTDTGWMTPEVKRELTAIAPFGRVGLPEDAANLVLFLASPQGQWITGQILHARGGF
jgi:3-oxoacyl-[acyl-carrier protein] reductase